MFRGLQLPSAVVRVSGEMYAELRDIAEVRDCTLNQAMEFYYDRKVKEALKPVEIKIRRTKGKK